MNNKIDQNDNLFNLLVYRSIYDGEHPSLWWVSTSTASLLAKVSDDWLHPSNQSTHPSIPGQVSDEHWMGLTSFGTDVFLKGFTSSITYLILKGVVWAGITWETKMQLVKVHPQELRSVFPHVDFTNVPRHNGNIRLRVTACLRLCHRRA